MNFENKYQLTILTEENWKPVDLNSRAWTINNIIVMCGQGTFDLGCCLTLAYVCVMDVMCMWRVPLS